MKKILLCPGAVHRIHLPKSEWHCVIARKSPTGAYFLGYFFYGQLIEADLIAKNASCIQQVSRVFISDRTWPFVKKIENWKPQDWPVPVFQTTLPGLSGEETSRVVIYAENIEDRKFEHWPKDQVKGFPEDGLAGCKFMENRLERIAKQLSESK